MDLRRKMMDKLQFDIKLRKVGDRRKWEDIEVYVRFTCDGKSAVLDYCRDILFIDQTIAEARFNEVGSLQGNYVSEVWKFGHPGYRV